MTSEKTRLDAHARVALILNGLYSAAEALCNIFVGVYLWVNSQDFNLVCRHYLALFIVTPIAFIFAGWYSAAHDRLHMYRLGLFLHGVYYATLLTLGPRSPDYAIWLGVLLGVTWGAYWVGANTFSFDVTRPGRRDYYLGLLNVSTGVFKLIGPFIGGVIIQFSPTPSVGYRWMFGLVVVVYLMCFVLSFRMPEDSKRRPFRLLRALLPGPHQRDWRLIMLASASLAGSFQILAFLLGLLMFVEVGTELSVGMFGSFQALAGIAVAYLLGRALGPSTWKRSMRWGAILLVGAGLLIVWKLSLTTLILFGFLRAAAEPLVGIPHFSVRLDIIAKDAEVPAQRIEYLCAWEVPLAIGRVIMMLILMGLYGDMNENSLGLRVSIFLLCAIRFVTYLLVSRTSPMQDA